MKALILLGTAALYIGIPQAIALPSILLQPTDQTVNQGFNAGLRATGKGAAPLEFQWFFASHEIAGAHTNLLVLTKCQPSDAGEYVVVLTDPTGSVTSRVAMLTVNLPVALNAKLGPNTRIGSDPLTTTNLHQAEMHVDRSPSDPNLLIASYQDILEGDNAQNTSYAVSKDGGVTWAAQFIPGVTKPSGGQFDFTCDNVGAIDLNGNLFLISIGYASGGDITSPDQAWRQLFSASFDQGQSFLAPVELASDDKSTYPDKGWLAVNNFPNSPHPGRIAFTFTQASRDNTKTVTVLRLSDDRGKTWSAPKTIGPLQAVGTQTFFMPNGALAVLYRRYLQSGYTPNLGAARMEIIMSPDGGETFGAPILVQAFPSPAYSLFPAVWDAIHFPSACSDRQAGVIFVAYQAYGAARRRSIMFQKSIDQGQTWSAPVPVNDTPSNLEVFNPAVAVSPDGQHVVVEFYDKRNQTITSAGKNVDLYLAESFDGGDTWEPNIRLSDFSSDLRKGAERIDAGGGVILGDYQALVPSLNFETPAVATWIDTRAGNNDPYSVQIRRTKGTTFQTWQKLRFSTNDLANAAISGEGGDPDGDGIANLAEYAFGLEPDKADLSPIKAALSGTGNAQEIRLSFERLAVLSDLKFTWQNSTDLIRWTTVTSPPIRTSISPGREPVMEREETTFAANGQTGFFRLIVERR